MYEHEIEDMPNGVHTIMIIYSLWGEKDKKKGVIRIFAELSNIVKIHGISMYSL